MTPLKNNCKHSTNKQYNDLGRRFNVYFTLICSPMFISAWHFVIFNLIVIGILLVESRALDHD